MALINVHGQDIFVRDEGTGPSLIFLHGFLADHRMWAPQFSANASSNRVVAWDAPGRGQSTDAPDEFTLTEYSGCLKDLMDALSVSDAHVVGLSWGGALAIHFAATHASCIRSLTLVNTHLGWVGSLGAAVAQQRLEMCARDSQLFGANLAAKWAPGLVAGDVEQEVASQVRKIVADFHPRGFYNYAKTLAESDLRNELTAIQAPTMLLWGEQDQRSPPSLTSEFLKCAPHARLVILPRAGHLPNLVRPEQFNKALSGFIAA